LWGVRSEIRRDPFGKVLVLGTWNYPLLLVGVQVAQALAAGNEVMLKPAIGCESISEHLAEAFYRVGVPSAALRVLSSSTEAAVDAIGSGVDLVVLTGAASTGRAVLRQLADKLTPAILELSGCDAVVVQPGANLDLAARSLAVGLTFNGGATCIGPRRLIAESATMDALLERLDHHLREKPAVTIHPAARSSVVQTIEAAIAAGAIDRLGRFDAKRLREQGTMLPLVLEGVRPNDPIASADLFAPVVSTIRVNEIVESIEIVNRCPYRLAASIFGPRSVAESLAAKLQVGSIAVNDMILPTADPRVSFGGRGQSGYGVTRGAEGLLSMTVPVVTGVRRGRFMPHLMPRQSTDAQRLLGALQLMHGRGIAQRWQGFRKILGR
jgi:aldehyde dehydrogenase (NAD+)